ncbi:MAG: PLP-dependent aspartate aminotransferase family protein, partial [Thermoplasmata archaeon]|nr:PLP-dependent aspartate aminotransferase family protein [Thermoplasmata archaeon]
NTPIYLSSTFAQSAPNQNKGYVYGRTSNPTRTVLERVLADLEGGRRGLAFSSGLGALTTLLEDLPSGSRIVAGSDLYGGTRRLFEHHRTQFGLAIDYVATSETDAFARALDAAPAEMVYVESPTNPLIGICDLARVGELARRHRARFVVDNTFASPALQRPIEHGADVVLHSTTKYLGGHSDILGGALVARRRATGERLAWLQNAVGAIPSPVDSFLVLRGIRTLGVRMRRHCEGAQAVAEALASSGKVLRVHYPGLKDHPQHKLARKQMDGFGGMLSAEVRGGASAAGRLLRRLRVFTLAESLGGVESLAEHPASMTHSSVPKAAREAVGITDGLLRFSVGIEDPADLVDDVVRGLRSV